MPVEIWMKIFISKGLQNIRVSRFLKPVETRWVISLQHDKAFGYIEKYGEKCRWKHDEIRSKRLKTDAECAKSRLWHHLVTTKPRPLQQTNKTNTQIYTIGLITVSLYLAEKSATEMFSRTLKTSGRLNFISRSFGSGAATTRWVQLLTPRKRKRI